MSVVIVTGSSGLVGAETVRRFHDEGYEIVGIDNNFREVFFGSKAGTSNVAEMQKRDFPNFRHEPVDIRDTEEIRQIFKRFSGSISGVVHCAAQPSHDWSASNPKIDFEVNANGTLNLLEAFREFSPEAVFIFMSTNKVYGDSPNSFPMVEAHSRWELDEISGYSQFGFDEKLSIDGSTHSPFGVSKAAADLMVQEYGRYFGLKTVVFRGGCLTGPLHQGAELHGFLSYLVRCAVWGEEYTVFGYKGKQVRDNIHSRDLVSAFWEAFNDPEAGEVYNIGGSRFANVSVLEAIEAIERRSKRKLGFSIDPGNRKGDHIWYVSDIRKFEVRYPSWKLTLGIEDILREMVEAEEFRRVKP